MKINKKGYIQKAVHKFTDREEPRKAFWDKYQQVKSEMTPESDIHVLTYYGIGGIGKSRLLEKLQYEMEEKLENPYYTDIDFKDCKDIYSSLKSLRNKLIEKYKFDFSLFDMGCYNYSQKVGEKIESNEVAHLTDKSRVLSYIKTGLGAIPLVNIASEVLDLAIPQWMEHVKKNKRELTQIEIKTAEELYNYLPWLFAVDMTNNVEKLEEPLVMFIDTYELLVNELMQVGDPLQNDLWIRGENGLVQNIPNVLWVIGGREKLKWENFNSDWSEALEQHLLGTLSFADSDSFLSGEGVDDAELRKSLYDLTKGTPLYLDLCVDQYNDIKEKGEIPVASMFGKDTEELISRFVRYMDDSHKDFMFMLSCIKNWDDKLIADIAPSVLSNFSITAYEKAKDYSFVSVNDYGYSIHQTIGEVLLEKCPEIIKQKTAEKLIEWAKVIVDKNDVFSEEYPKALSYMLQAAFILYDDNEQLRQFYVDNLQKKSEFLVDAGIVDVPQNMLDLLLSKCDMENKDLLYACVMNDKAYIHDFHGEFQKAKEINNEAILIYTNLLGDTHVETLNSLHNSATYYSNMGDDKKALEIELHVLEQYEAIYDENHDKVLNSKHNLATYYSGTGNSKKALEMEQQTLLKYTELYGDNHFDTMNSMHCLASYYSETGNNKKSLEILKEVYERRVQVLGEKHPDTITSLNNILGVYSDMGDNKTALEIAFEAYEKRKEILGENHPDTMCTLSNIAVYFSGIGDVKKALEIVLDVYDKRVEILGEDHPDTLITTNNMASYYSDIGNIAKAIELSQQTFEKEVDVLGENHPSTINTMYNLSTYYYSAGDFKKAIELAQKSYNTACEFMGERHPFTIKYLNGVIQVLMLTGNNAKAMFYKNKLKNKKKH